MCESDALKMMHGSAEYRRLLKSLLDAGWETREAVIIVKRTPKKVVQRKPRWKYF